MSGFIRRFFKDPSGASAIEYGLIAGLVSIAIVGAATTLGANLTARFTMVATALQ